MRVFKRQPYGPINARGKPLKLDMFVPEGARAAVLYMHGGGFSFGRRSDASSEHLRGRLCPLGYAVGRLSYRLGTPEQDFPPAERAAIHVMRTRSEAETGIGAYLSAHKFMAGLEDLSAAVAFVRDHHADWGIASPRVAVLGVSAGGVAGLSLACPPEGWEDRLARPDAVAAIAATMVQPWRLSAAAPPCLVFHGSQDRVIAPDKVRDVAARAQALGAPFEAVETGIRGHRHQADAVFGLEGMANPALFDRLCRFLAPLQSDAAHRM